MHRFLLLEDALGRTATVGSMVHGLTGISSHSTLLYENCPFAKFRAIQMILFDSLSDVPSNDPTSIIGSGGVGGSILLLEPTGCDAT